MMKQLFSIICVLSLALTSCEKEDDKPDINDVETYLQNYSGFIYQYSSGSDTVDVEPSIDISFDLENNSGTIEAQSFTWSIDDSRVSISGSFFENLPNYETPFNNYVDFVYHAENLNRALKLDTFYHVSGGVEYTYYLKNQ